MSTKQNTTNSLVGKIGGWLHSVSRDARRLQEIEAEPQAATRVNLIIEPEQLTGHKINQVKAAMLYALLATASIDPAHANNGYDWLSGQQPETEQRIDLSEVCGGSRDGRG